MGKPPDRGGGKEAWMCPIVYRMRFPGSRSELRLLMYAAFCCFGGNHWKSSAIAAMAAIVEIIRLSPGDRCFRWLAAVGSLPE